MVLVIKYQLVLALPGTTVVQEISMSKNLCEICVQNFTYFWIKIRKFDLHPIISCMLQEHFVSNFGAFDKYGNF